MQLRFFRTFPAAALLAAVLLVPARADQPLASAAGLVPSDTTSSAWLHELYQTIKDKPYTDDADPRLAILRNDITQFEALNVKRESKSREAFELRMDKLNKKLDEGDLTKAMASAVEAHDLAPNRDGFLLRADIKQLVASAEKQANEYETNQQWLEAVALYRRLDLLFESQRKYRDQVKRISSRLRMLRTYAPNAWYAQQAAYAKEHNDPEPKKWAGQEDDTWEKQLEQVDASMLRRIIVLAARQHVESTDFEQLMRGGIAGLFDLLGTNGLEESFPSLTDKAKVNDFASELMRLRGRVDGRTVAMSYGDASAMVRDLILANRKTIDLPEQVILYEFGEGAVTTLDDFSANIWPAQKKRFERTTKGKFTGVGIQITLTDGELTVVSPLEDTPAHRAGIKAGDRIVTVDGRPTTGISLDQAVEQITGPKGTQVVLGIRTPGEDDLRKLTLTRAIIKITSTKGWRRKPGGQWDYYIDPTLKLGYVRMTQFGPETADALDEAVEQMRNEKGINGLVLDLRFNPGGLLTAAIAIGNRFIDEGVIVSGQAQAGQQTWKAEADTHHTYKHFPVVCLINRGSASASEIVAGALQDYRRGIIVGEQSYGKGSVQQVLWHSDEQAALKLTTQYYVLPSGRVIHRRPKAKTWGIVPDINVRMTDRQVESLLKARMLLDVLRETDDEVNADALISKKEGDEDEPKEEELPPVKDVAEILERGLDPQLEMGLIILKAQVLDEARG